MLNITNDMDKEIIKNNFSRFAAYYDSYSDIQNRCALELIGKVGDSDFKSILDVGCGTGQYTKLLREKFHGAAIKALDISAQMVKVAKEKLKDRNIEFVVADGETIDFKEKFDLITSNVAFQWFEDFKDTLRQYKRLLNKNGRVLFSVFGPNTFCELDKCLKILLGDNISVSSTNFLEEPELESILKAAFLEFKIEEKLYRQSYNSLSDLLMKIKYTGTRGNGLRERKFLTPKIVDKLESIYKIEFSNITATYQVFFCGGNKSDDFENVSRCSQDEPLITAGI